MGDVVNQILATHTAPSGAQTTEMIPNAPLSLVRRIRAAMAAAAISNAVDSPPWLPPATLNTGPGNQIRANATAYPAGCVITNAAGTHQFVVRVTGTTAGAEPATVTTPLVTATPYNMGDIADGTASLNWLGPVRTTTANPNAPVVSSGAKPAQLSVAQNFGAGGAYGAALTSLFQFSGGVGAICGGTNTFLTYSLGGLVIGGSSQVDALGATGFGPQCNSVTFMTDAPLIALDLTTGAQASGLAITTQVYIEIDGIRLMDGPLQPIVALAAASGFILLDWRANGGRKQRKIRLSVGNSTGQPSYGRIYVTPQDQISYPYNPNRYVMAFGGDSLVAGSASSSQIPSFDRVAQLGSLIGCDHIVSLGVGGTGYIAAGAGYNYIGRLRDIVRVNPDVLYMANNFNDSGSTSAQRAAAVLSYLQGVRAVLPNGIIILGGTVGGTSPTNNALLETDIATGVAQFGDRNTFFLPMATDPTPYETGTGNLGATNGSGNNDIYKGPSDTTHLSFMGIQNVVRREANALRNLFNSLSSY